MTSETKSVISFGLPHKLYFILKLNDMVGSALLLILVSEKKCNYYLNTIFLWLAENSTSLALAIGSVFAFFFLTVALISIFRVVIKIGKMQQMWHDLLLQLHM